MENLKNAINKINKKVYKKEVFKSVEQQVLNEIREFDLELDKTGFELEQKITKGELARIKITDWQKRLKEKELPNGIEEKEQLTKEQKEDML